MSVMALHQTDREVGVVLPVIRGFVRWRALVVTFALVFPLMFYLLLLAVLVVEYGHLPNYVTPYNWISNVLRIIASTPSVADMAPIILDEWLFETGYINFDYGHGVAEWSLSIIPYKLAIVSLIGALTGLNFGLLLDRPTIGSLSRQFAEACGFAVLTCAGALSASVTNATVFSVVHCATPSWVGSLAVLGFDSYDVFAIEPFGPFICLLGLAALVGPALLLARDWRAAAQRIAMQPLKEGARC